MDVSIILQHIQISNLHIAHLKVIQCYISVMYLNKIGKNKEFYSEHSNTQHIDSAPDILFYHLCTPLSIHLIFFADPFQMELQTLLPFPQYLNMLITRVLFFSKVKFAMKCTDLKCTINVDPCVTQTLLKVQNTMPSPKKAPSASLPFSPVPTPKGNHCSDYFATID